MHAHAYWTLFLKTGLPEAYLLYCHMQHASSANSVRPA